jgi:phenylacetic acid degradation operon negative regulatory protein
VLSTLLGTHPPHLPTNAFVAVGELFDVPPGTVRTALSRMVADGELLVADSRYELGSAFVARQRALDAGRHARRVAWDGSWWTAVVLADRRPLADRRAFRVEMTRALMGELRPEVWLRPANLPPPEDGSSVLVARGSMNADTSRQLCAGLWDLEHLRAALDLLLHEAERVAQLLDRRDTDVLAESFIVSVAAARTLATEPQLPEELVGETWPADDLRHRYDELEAVHGRVLHHYLKEFRNSQI